MRCQQCLHFPAQFLIAGAGLVQKHTSPIWLSLERFLQQFIDLLPAFRSHNTGDE